MIHPRTPTRIVVFKGGMRLLSHPQQPTVPWNHLHHLGRRLGIAQKTVSDWQRQFGGLAMHQACRLRELEREAHRLQRLLEH